METMEATVDRLPAKRRELLLLLKKRGEAGADELADQFGVTASAIRQQLDLLAEEGLVAHREDRGSRGRPRHRYHLTPEAEVLFPKTYSELTNELLDYVRDSDPDLVEAIFERRRQRRVEGAVARLAGMSFPEPGARAPGRARPAPAPLHVAGRRSPRRGRRGRRRQRPLHSRPRHRPPRVPAVAQRARHRRQRGAPRRRPGDG